MNNYDNSLRTQNVHSVGFGLLDPRVLIEQSVCEVNTYVSNIKETSNDANSVLDPRMGTTVKSDSCPTCYNMYNECPGHFGHIVLAKPSFNILFLPFILKIMKTTCANCGAILLPNEDQLDDLLKIPAKNRLAYLTTLPRTSMQCSRCKAYQPKYNIYKNDYICILRYDREAKKDKKGATMSGNPTYALTPKKLTAEDVYKFLSAIPDEQCQYYGMDPKYARPEWMIWTILPVPPIHVRMILSTGYNSKPSIDDLTVALNTDIVKINEELKIMIQNNETEDRIGRKWDTLQNSINQYINNEGMRTRLQHKNGRLMKSIVERLKTKKGLVRNNLEGKRVNESARSVVTCDPDLDIDQVGIPRKIAIGLSFPETVNAYNIDKMRTLVQHGPFVYPGARSIRKLNGKLYALVTYDQCRQMARSLQYGDVVNRNLVDNDLVMLNRQPSLHRMNIMAHRVKVLDFDTFRINPNVTTPYNADFDGDEMNIFCITNYMQLAELKYLMHVSTQFISPQINLPIIGTVQDSTLAPYLLSRKNKLTINTYQNLLGAIFTNNNIAINLEHVRNVDNNVIRLLSLLFPTSFSYTSKNFKVDNGIVSDEEHDINKNNLVANNYNTFFHCAFNTLGAGMTNQMFNSFAKLANEYFIIHGFSTGIRDCMPPDDFSIEEELNNYHDDVTKLIQLISDTPKSKRLSVLTSYGFEENKRNKWLNLINLSDEEIFDAYPLFVQNLWNAQSVQVDQKVNQVYDSCEVGLAKMIYSGSKGSKKNLNAIMALLGQQDVEGHWILQELNHRTLPHFPKDTDLPEMHGFITHSYYGGLDPVDYYFQAIAGRFSQMLKSIKTADTGYFQRCFIKMFENIYAAHDGSIRNSFGSVIEYLYGGDGFNVNNLIRVDISDMKLGVLSECSKLEKWNNSTLPEKSLKSIFSMYKKLFTAVHNSFIQSRRVPSHIMVPVDVQQITKDYNHYNFRDYDIFMNIGYFFESLANLYGPYFYLDYPKLAIILMQTIYYKSNPMAIGVIMRTIQKSRIKSSENIGIIMAQSIGQPTTQISLNAFHNSGRSTSVTSGVPRLKELVRLSSKIATPSMTIVVNRSEQDVDDAQFIKANISDVTIKKVLNSYTVMNDGNKRFTLSLMFERFDMLINSVSVLDIDITIQQVCLGLNDLHCTTNWEYKDKLYYYVDMEYILNPTAPNTMIEMVGILPWINQVIENTILTSHIHGFNGIKESEIVKSSTQIPFIGKDDQGNTIIQELGNYPYSVITMGTNLLDVLALLKNINHAYTITNDVIEIYQLMGIEAARSAMLHEIDIVMNSDSDSIDRRHLEMLVNVMTHPGFMISMDRHGMIKSTSAPLQRASFEETTKQIITAAMFNEDDPMNSISSNIMFGQIIPTGTGSCKLRLNPEKFRNLIMKSSKPSQEIEIVDQPIGMLSLTDYFEFVLDPNL